MISNFLLKKLISDDFQDFLTFFDAQKLKLFETFLMYKIFEESS